MFVEEQPKLQSTRKKATTFRVEREGKFSTFSLRWDTRHKKTRWFHLHKRGFKVEISKHLQKSSLKLTRKFALPHCLISSNKNFRSNQTFTTLIMLKSISKKIPPNQAIIGLLGITGLLRSSSKVSRRRSRKRGPNFFPKTFPLCAQGHQPLASAPPWKAKKLTVGK